MKYLLLAGGALILAGCGPSVPPPTNSTAVVIPKPPNSAMPDGPLEAPEVIVPVKPRMQIAIGDSWVCLRLDTSLRCWSRAKSVPTPIVTLPPIADIGNVVDVAVGMRHVCAVNDAGLVYCWGENSLGQLGARRVEERIDSPVRVEGLEGAVAITAGMMHSCALLKDGRVSCWGWNALGQTGGDAEYTRDARELVVAQEVAGISGATAVAAGRGQSCAMLKAGVYCWGESMLRSQATPRGYRDNRAYPVEELAELKQFAFNEETACALFKDGHAGCWGSGVFSLVPGRPLHADSPLTLMLPPAKTLVVGKYHGCAILQDGRVTCFGWNNHGELGRPANEDYNTHEAEIVPGLPTDVTGLSLGSATSCAIVRNTELWCWGIPPHEAWEHGVKGTAPVRVPIDS
jgi:alpha-tubulin suppressor-like RCC1 family protein